MVKLLNLKKYQLYFDTLKYLKPAQFYHRGYFVFKRKGLFKTKSWKKAFKKEVKIEVEKIVDINHINLSFEGLVVTSEQKEVLKEQIKSLDRQEFYFLNKRIVFEDQMGWADTEISQLWRYNLHYFNYFRTLIEYEKLNASFENYVLMKRYVTSWIENNQIIGQGDGWHPYTISLRLVNWILTYSAFSKYLNDDQEFRSTFLESIVAQNKFLLNNLEYDVVGNHLFENLKTLILCGMFYNKAPLGAKSKLIGEKEMIKQLNEQFHSDGGHFELSAMYHSILLKGLTELTFLYRNLGFDIPKKIIQVEQKAYIYLANVVHPDGEIPLFNDAAFGIADSPEYLFDYAINNGCNNLSILDSIVKMKGKGEVKKEFPKKNKIFYAQDTGYLKSEDNFLYSILDVGKPCPDYLPAHAHADIFSYELSYKGKRMVVDTGTYEYSGSKRDYDRSTLAHNTVTINGENQSQVWGNFRVAKRGFPSIKRYKESKFGVEIIASHDGYKKNYGALHTRKYKHIFNQTLLILDEVNTNEKVNSYIHLHPETIINLIEDDIYVNGNEIIIKPINASFSVDEAFYHPQFGEELTNKKITISPKDNTSFGYYYCYGEDKFTFTWDQILIDQS